MKKTIKRSQNTYERIYGTVLGWQRGHVGEGHQVQIISKPNNIDTINWRSPKDPTAGDQVIVVMHKEGVSAKKDRPLMILNHTTGDMHREVNAHDPKGSRRIMTKLVIWVLIAAIIAAILISYSSIEQARIIILASSALMVWRIAIATDDLKMDERASKRKIEEEAMCTEIAMEAWQDNKESRKPRLEITHDSKGNPVLKPNQNTENKENEG